MVLAAQDADTPVGKPVAVPMPVAPVVVCVILVKAVLIHKVGVVDAAVALLNGELVITRLPVPLRDKATNRSLP